MNEKKVMKKNERFSKALKEIDARLRFNKDKNRTFINLKKQLNQQKKNKEILSKKIKNHEDVIHNLQIIGNEKENYNIYSRNFKNSLSALNINLSSTMNNYYILPKINKIKSNFMDERKKNYNIIRFENVWKEQQKNEDKYNKEKKNENIIKYADNYEDIFDKNYVNYQKFCEDNKQKNMRLERIKSNNLKVNKKVQIFREIMKKFQDIREYCPNYSIIEKHQPEVKLNTKSKRIFPDQFIKRYIYNIIDDDEYKNNENKNIKKLKKNNSILNYKNNFEIRRFMNKNKIINKRNDANKEKKKFFLSDLNIIDSKEKSFLSEAKNKNRSMVTNKKHQI